MKINHPTAMQNPEEWDGIPMPRRVLAVLAIMAAISLSVMDGVIVNTALPTLCGELGITSSESIWIINAYQISVVVSLLIFSALGDFIGYRPIYLFGLSLFTIMSVGCAMSWSFESLVACRVLQGLGASAIMSINTSIVRLIYPKRMLGRGIGLNSTVVSVSAVAGPTVATAILAVADWQWLFAVNLPLGIVAIILGYLYLPHNVVYQDMRAFHWQDAILSALSFGLLFAVVSGFSHGVNEALLLVAVVAAVVVGYIFVRSQLRRTVPILPFDLLRTPIFSLSIATSIMIFVAQMSIIVAMPFILQHQFGYSAIEVGLVLTAWPAMNMITTPVSGYLVERFHAGVLACIGLSVMVLGLFMMLFLPDAPTQWDFIWRLAICGCGFGFFQAPNNSLVISSASLQRSGSASGMMATARLIGQISGASAVAMLFYILPDDLSTDIFYLSILIASVAALLTYSRLSLPLPESIRIR